MTFLAQARRTFAPSMRQRLGLDALYSEALAAVRRERVDGVPAAALPAFCPFTLQALLRPGPDLDRLIARLTPPPAAEAP